jgi:hypothetical protein
MVAAVRGLGWKTLVIVTEKQNYAAASRIMSNRGVRFVLMGLTETERISKYDDVAFLVKNETAVDRIVHYLTNSKTAYSTLLQTADSATSTRIMLQLGSMVKMPRGLFVHQCNITGLLRVQTTSQGKDS